jgi:hypothetical protein
MITNEGAGATGAGRISGPTRIGIVGLLTVAASIAGIASAAHEYGWFGPMPPTPPSSQGPILTYEPPHRYFHATVLTQPGYVVKVHSAPSSISPVVGKLDNGASVNIECTTEGDVVRSLAGQSGSLWNRTTSGGYIADVLLNTGTNQPTMPKC